MAIDVAFFSSVMEAELRAHVGQPTDFLGVGTDPGNAGGSEDALFVRDCAEEGLSLGELARLGDIDPASLGHAERVDLVRALERARAMLDGLQQHALASVWAATRACGLEGEAARHEVGAALRLSAGTAAERVGVADALTHRLPATLQALCEGEIGYLHARHLADTITPLSDEVAAAVETAVLPDAPGQSLGEFRRAVARAVIAADPQGAAQRAEAAAAKRRITRHPLPEAMEGWWLTLPAHLAGPAWERLTDQAKTTQRAIRDQHGIDPGLDALRVDTLVAAILGDQTGGDSAGGEDDEGDASSQDGTSSAGDGGPGDGGTGGASGTGDGGRLVPLPRCRCGGAQTVAVVVDLPTLLGLANNPGEVPGYGPVPASVARALAADRDWERWTTHPHTRALLDRSPLTYRPGRRLRGFVAAAHRTCGFPGCTQPAENTDLDHRVTHRRGGRTIVVNLGPLCRTHHNAKTSGRWRITYDPDTADGGQWTWTSPLGKTYQVQHDPPLRT